MKREIRDKWVAALRSGRYHKGTNYLKTTYQGRVFHCALGVLAEELGLFDGQDGKMSTVKGSPHRFPDSFMATEIQNDVSLRNDRTPMTFSDLANYIESRIPCEE